jgi:asparagine synthase (glutamine-hydrolysing)
MCGIAGILSKQEVPKGLIESMTSTMAHRGPDADCTLKVNPNLHLGHRRLSIIDLSDAANQPMVSHCGNFSLVFNGEIYNYPELKAELTQHHAATFKTNSDSEVIIEAYRAWGANCLDRFNGMFAFALFDQQQDTLFIARDRIGIKPIYYLRNETVFAFASELKGLMPLTKHFGKLTMNESAVMDYFRLGYIAAPKSIYNEIQKFPQGSYALITNGKLDIEKYWDAKDEIQSETIKDSAAAHNQLHELIQSSIDFRLRSDVPFGAFLSGGIDSSLVSAMAQQRSSHTINTFSIGFNQAKHNESFYAEQVAKHIGSNHHLFTVDYAEAQGLIEKLPTMYDEPFADSSAIPTFLVSQLASKKVKMVLSGDGGDEQFMGYGMYTWAHRLNKPSIRATKKLIHQALLLKGGNRNKRAAEMFNFLAETNLQAHIFSVDQYLFSQNELNRITTRGMHDFQKTTESFHRHLSSAEEQAFYDLTHYLPDDLLVKVDRASMQSSIEARVPLLDHRIVSLSLNIDEKLKSDHHQSKLILREVLYDYIPEELFDRPKWGFSIPLDQWLSEELGFLIDKHVLGGSFYELNLFHKNRIEELVQRFRSGETFLYNKIWLFIQFNCWYETHKQYLA